MRPHQSGYRGSVGAGPGGKYLVHFGSDQTRVLVSLRGHAPLSEQLADLSQAAVAIMDFGDDGVDTTPVRFGDAVQDIQFGTLDIDFVQTDLAVAAVLVQYCRNSGDPDLQWYAVVQAGGDERDRLVVQTAVVQIDLGGFVICLAIGEET